MVSTNNTQELLASLEELLVKEFRSCQSLQGVTKDERSVLSNGDASILLILVEQKEALLDELGRIEDERRMIVQKLAQIVDPKLESQTVIGLLPKFDPVIAGRLGRLCEGITAIIGQVRESSRGNQALAASAVKRVDAVQAFLLSLYQPPASYQPSSALPTAEEPAAPLEVNQLA